MSGPQSGRRAQVRRHRRERQIIVFGALAVGIGFIALLAAGVYRGTIDAPFSEAFITPEGQFDSSVDLVCPPPNTLPLEPSQVALRVLNGTEIAGLAGSLSDDLAGRGFVSLDPGNWSRSYGDNVRIIFGETGVVQAYTLAAQFENEVDLVFDTRETSLVDVVLGSDYAAAPGLRSPLAPELSRELTLSANEECLPVGLVTPEPAPRSLPVNPLDPSPAPSASPTP